jgi:hypothetical protein
VPTLRIEAFTGIVPKVTAGLLPDNAAQIARNVRLESRAIMPWYGETQVHCPGLHKEIKTIYRFAGPPDKDPVWFVSTEDMDFVRGPVADVSEYRLYYTGDGITPRKTNWAMATANGKAPYPNTYYEMGTPGPKTAPTLTSSGGGEPPKETRAYVYTFVTEFGAVLEESAPSDAALITVNAAGDSVTITDFDAPPQGNYNYRYIRIYRSVTGSSTVNYQLVAQIDITTLSYTDTLTVEELGLILPSSYFTPPPEGLRGIVAMPGGILAGFVGNQVWFSEPYIPHAWPSTYMQTTDYPVVGMAVLNNTLVVLTERYPYTFVGSTPTGMTSDKMGLLEPCVSKLSITSDQYGVLYASPNGLVSISMGEQSVVTQQLIRRDQWQEYSPKTMFGEIYNNMYVGFYRGPDCKCRTLVVYRNDNPPLSNFDFPGTASFVEPTTGELYGVNEFDGCIYRLDDPNEPPKRDFRWKSKLFVLPNPTSFAWIQVLADFARYDPKSRPLGVKIFLDRELFYQFVATTTDPIRLPAGKKAYSLEVELVGTLPVLKVLFSTSAAELKEIA